jgi:hypothetical protein
MPFPSVTWRSPITEISNLFTPQLPVPDNEMIPATLACSVIIAGGGKIIKPDNFRRFIK